jgi:hypothetical protein
MRVLQGGNELCRIEGFDRRKAVSELKVSIEAEAGLVPALTRLINPESDVELQDHQTLEEAGTNQGVIQLYAQKLKKVVVADELQIAPGQVTDDKLAVLCDSIKDDPPDILVLSGCSRVTSISCLVQLSTISHLDISGCNLCAEGGFHLAGAIKDMGAISSANLLGNQIPVEQAHELVKIMQSKEKLTTLCSFSREEATLDVSNQGLGPGDAVLIANDISDMGGLLVLNLANNDLGKFGRGALKEKPSWWEDSDHGGAYGWSDDHYEQGKAEGIIALANAIPDLGAISSFTFSGERYRERGASKKAPAVTMETFMTEADFSGKYLGVSGATLLSAFLPKCT